MTTWTDVINYVRTRYEVLEETDGWLRFRLQGPDGRTQQVTVHHVEELHDGSWVEISSPVGWADKLDLRRLLELAGTSAVGGAAVVDGVALLKHTVPLEDLSIEHEFERPLKAVVARADSLEHELTQADEF
ncbi:hypothetical protein QRX60_33785 [Amycolatopsis mongoliensis]|uniref:Uncharacterized protein n=1 Tax=Amycolatopsis mongoliensis TaxID=715475 RepID=A0A9Y2JJS1_9PSEU|nr:hypothetical protein [Amycolatopsis sp. 4-36]WIX99004.1 hypothetical protein QRX60_33785 [Amycolatopsis sp. 4-36]